MKVYYKEPRYSRTPGADASLDVADVVMTRPGTIAVKVAGHGLRAVIAGRRVRFGTVYGSTAETYLENSRNVHASIRAFEAPESLPVALASNVARNRKNGGEDVWINLEATVIASERYDRMKAAEATYWAVAPHFAINELVMLEGSVYVIRPANNDNFALCRAHFEDEVELLALEPSNGAAHVFPYCEKVTANTTGLVFVVNKK